MAQIVITELAADRLREIIADGRSPESGGLRVYVDHQCHCGGLKLGMALDEPHDGDERTVASGIRIGVAPEVVDQPGTAEIDYVETALTTGFTLANSEHSCG